MIARVKYIYTVTVINSAESFFFVVVLPQTCQILFMFTFYVCLFTFYVTFTKDLTFLTAEIGKQVNFNVPGLAKATNMLYLANFNAK